MQLPIFEKYIDELIEKSTLDVPAWNIEKAREGKAAGWNYIDGCMILALLEIYNATGEKKYYEFADAFIDHRVQEDGTITKYSVEEYNIDNVNAGKTLFALYALNGKEKYRKAIDLIYSQVETQPRTEEGNFWHKKIYPNQVWLDGMYMGQPFYMEYETKFDDKKHYDDIFHQFANVVKYMRDPETGLYYHGYDASKKAFWCNKETGLSQNFWLRALGWYSMALLDTLSKCEPGEEYKAEYDNLKKVFVDLIDSMLKFQDESGMWYQLPALGGREPNYLETSGSAIMAYSLLKGVRLGFLPESYRAYGLKAFQGICDRYLKEKDGTADNLADNRPRQIEFNRLNLTYTVMSKRKLHTLVDEHMVSGWDDPRMPTLCGMRRRGYSPESIRKFIDSIGYTKFDALNDVALLEAAVRDDLNKKACRVSAVLDPVKLVITNYPDGETEEMEAINNPENEADGTHTITFSKELWIERADFMEDAPKKFFRLAPGREVRLKNAYIVKCTGCTKDAEGRITEIQAEYDPESKSGMAGANRRVKGTIHWVSASHCLPAEVREYDRLFCVENPSADDRDFRELLNPDSLRVNKGCYVEPYLAEKHPGDYLQFQRIGYFMMDLDSTADHLVFNKTVGLKDAWAKKQGGGAKK